MASGAQRLASDGLAVCGLRLALEKLAVGGLRLAWEGCGFGEIYHRRIVAHVLANRRLLTANRKPLSANSPRTSQYS